MKLLVVTILLSLLNISVCYSRTVSSTPPSHQIGFGDIVPFEEIADADESPESSGDANETSHSQDRLNEPIDEFGDEIENEAPALFEHHSWWTRPEKEGCFCRNETRLHTIGAETVEILDTACRCFGESVTHIPGNLDARMARL